MTSIARSAYRSLADAMAAMVFHVPLLERPLVRVGVRLWSRRHSGRFYRSVAGRYADRLRAAGRPYRRLTIGGAPLMVDVTEFTTRTLYFGNEPYEPATTEYIRSRLPRGGVFVDVGANHGYFTLIAAARVGATGRVFAFEPNPPVFDQLVTHVTLNGFDDRVVAARLALGDSPSDAAEFFVATWSGNSGVSTLTPAEEPIAAGLLSRDRRIIVPVDTLDRVLAVRGIGRVDLIKIDVECAEALVVKGMAGALGAGRIAAIVCETVWDGPAHRLLCASGFVPTRLEACGPGANIAYERG